MVKRKWNLYFITSIVTVLLLLLSSCLGPPDKAPAIPGPIIWLNRPQDFQLPNFKDKVTLFAFFTEDCSGCQRINPLLNKIIQKQGKAVQILGIYTPIPKQKTSIEIIKQFLKKIQVQYPVLYDSNSNVLRAFHVTGWPTLIIANSNGQIIYHTRGYQSAKIIQEKINTALSQSK